MPSAVAPKIREDMALTVKTLERPLWRILVEAYQAYLGDGPVLDADRRLDVKYARRLKAEKARRASAKGEA